MDISLSLIKKNGSLPCLIGYLPALYPDRKQYRELLRVCAQSGLRFLEIGLPVQDPYLDGKVIREALQAVGSRFRDLEALIASSVADTRNAGIQAILMLYNETYERYQPREFSRLCAESGAEAVLIPNLPLEGKKRLHESLSGSPVKTVNFIRHDADAAEIEEVLSHTTGFVYIPSMSGVTGGRFTSNEATRARVKDIIAAASLRGLPTALGFGISTPDDALEAARMGTDAVIVGTACVEAAAKGSPALEAYLRGFSAFLRKEGVCST